MSDHQVSGTHAVRPEPSERGVPDTGRRLTSGARHQCSPSDTGVDHREERANLAGCERAEPTLLLLVRPEEPQNLAVPGVRLTWWLAGLIIIAAGILATGSLRAARAVAPVPRTASALDELLLQEGAEIVSGLTGPITEVRRSHEKGEPPPPPDLAVAPDPPTEPEA